MPWKETCPMDERMRFITAMMEDDDRSFAELCREFGISRKTGYKWVGRYETLGPRGLQETPREDYVRPSRLDPQVVDTLVQARKEKPRWGPLKLRAWVAERDPSLDLPAHSTIGKLLKDLGLIRPRRRRVRVPLHVLDPLEAATLPNSLWCADFKGHFALGDRTRCHPLTITDATSRYLIKCEALERPREEEVRQQFELAFREFGMPLKIRTDNGAPFASLAAGGLSRLSVWWIKLGIEPERIEPGKPQQNGRHERMHRTLKDEATHPPGHTRMDQQRVFDRFRGEYNEVRPHEALGQKPPARVYAPSARVFPTELCSPQYPDSMTVRWTDPYGRISWGSRSHEIARFLAKEPIGLKEIGPNEWQLFYGPVLLGVMDRHQRTPRFQRLCTARRTRGRPPKM
jgi:putative transposase